MNKLARKARKWYRAVGGKRVFAAVVAAILIASMLLPLLWSVAR